MTNNKYITRFKNQDGSEAWRVRLHRICADDNTTKFNKDFYDHHLGSKNKALKAAIRWRNAIITEHGAPLGRFKLVARPRAWQEMTGVSFGIDMRHRKNGSIHMDYFCCTTWVEGPKGARKYKKKHFYYHKSDSLAKEQAHKSAVELRLEMERLHYSHLITTNGLRQPLKSNECSKSQL